MNSFNLTPLVTLNPPGGVPTAISYGLRITFANIAGLISAVVADNTIRGRGVTQDDVAAGAVGLAIYSNQPGTRPGILSATVVTYGDTLYAAGGGQVATTGTVIVGVSLVSTTTNGAMIEYDASGTL